MDCVITSIKRIPTGSLGSPDVGSFSGNATFTFLIFFVTPSSLLMKSLTLSALLLLTPFCSADIVRTYTGTSTTVCTTVNGTGTTWECTETCTWKSVITATATNKITVGVESSPNLPSGPTATLTDLNGAPILVAGVVLTLEPSAAVTEQLVARYGGISPDHAWHGFTTNVPLTAGGPVGSQVGFKLKFTWPTTVSPQGAIYFSDDGAGAEGDFSLIPPLCASPITFKGLAHCPQGNGVVTVTPAGGLLSVTNIGSSGQDGVAIELPNVSHWESRWAPLDPTNSLPFGAFVGSAIYGSAGTVNNNLLGFWRCTKLAQSDYGVTANFTALGATTVTAQVYDGATLVTTVPGVTGQFVRVNGCVDDDHWGNPTPDGPFGLPGKFGGALTFLSARQFTFPNSTSSVVGNRLVILPDGAPSVSALTKALVVAKNIPRIDIDQERHFVNYKGLAHGSLGQANVRKGGSLLTVSNLGSSGQDGVSVDLGVSEAFLTEIPLTPGLPVGGYMVSNFTGPNALGTMVPLGKVGMRRLPSSMVAIVDFSDVGSPSYTAVVYRAGVPVLSGSGLSGEVVRMTADGVGRIECKCDFVNLSWTWKFPPLFGSLAAFTIPGAGTNVPGDQIVFTPDVGAPGQVRPNLVSITGADMPMFQFSDEGIRKYGIDVAGLGTATIKPTADCLRVNNIGSSGQDGVEVDFPASLEHVAVDWENPDATDQLPVGATARMRLLAYGGGLLVTKTAAHTYALNADLATTGAPSWTVEVYNGRNLVQTLVGQTNPLVATMSKTPIDFSAGRNPKTGCWYVDIKIDFSDFFNLSNGTTVAGDRIVVRPEGGLAAAEHDKLQITTTQIPSLNIFHVEKTLRSSGLAHTSVGQANVQVVSSQAAGWYRCPGLLVSNIGSSGQDGVSVDLPPSQAFSTVIPGDPNAPVGAFMSSTAYAGGVATEVIGMRRMATNFNAIVDFSGLGSPTYTAKIFRHGSYVGGGTGLSGEVVNFSYPAGFDYECTRDAKTNCWRWRIWIVDQNGDPFSAFRIAGGPTIEGDEILFIPTQVPAPAPSATRIEMKSNMPAFQIVNETLRLHGLEHFGLGAAALDLSATTGGLQLYNLGSSGQDGVSVHFGQAGYATLGLNPGSAATAVDGSFVEMTAKAKFNGIENSPMVVGRVQDVGDQYALSLRYLLGLRGSALRVDVYNGATLVDSQNLAFPASGSTGALVTFSERPLLFDWIWWLVDTLGSMQSIVSSPVVGPVSLSGHAPVMGDKIVISVLNPTGTFSHLSDVEVRSTGLSGMSVFEEQLGMFHHSHTAAGGAALVAKGGKLVANNIGSSGLDGVEVTLGRAESCECSWLPLDTAGPPSVGSEIQLDFKGSINDVPDQSLGLAKVSRQPGATAFTMAADLNPLGSPTIRVEVWDHATLVAVLPGIPGGNFGTASRWPIGGGKTGRRFGPWVLGCIRFDYPDLTNFAIGTTTLTGNQVLMLQESPPSANYLSSYTITGMGLNGADATSPGFTITSETATPLSPPAGFSKIRFDCTYKLIPPTCTWKIVRDVKTLPDAFAGVVYHLQEAFQVPVGSANFALSVETASGTPVAFAPASAVAEKAQQAHPAPQGYLWVGFQSVPTFGGAVGTTPPLIQVYSTRVSFGTPNPALVTGASWFGSDAPPNSGHPAGELFQAFTNGPALDRDGDGMPDAYELSHGLNPDLPSNTQDSDGDGMNDGQEYVAGTDPASPASVLRVDNLLETASGWLLRFQATPGSAYLLEESSDLSAWDITQVLPPSSVPHTSDTYVPSRMGPRFLRIRLKD